MAGLHPMTQRQKRILSLLAGSRQSVPVAQLSRWLGLSQRIVLSELAILKDGMSIMITAEKGIDLAVRIAPEKQQKEQQMDMEF